MSRGFAPSESGSLSRRPAEAAEVQCTRRRSLLHFLPQFNRDSLAFAAQVCNYIHTKFATRSRAAMSKRINIMIDDDTWGVLGRIPAGERSRTINEAIRDWTVRRRRRDAVREMDALRTQLPKVSTDEVARWIRDDRERGH